MSQNFDQTVPVVYGWESYYRYLLVSGGVGMATIACRELLGLIVFEQRGLWYGATVGGAYLFGIVLNYICQRVFTFPEVDKCNTHSFFRFAVVALCSALLTVGFSTALLSALLQWHWLHVYAPSIAFVCGALTVSPFSFHLARKWVFKK